MFKSKGEVMNKAKHLARNGRELAGTHMPLNFRWGSCLLHDYFAMVTRTGLYLDLGLTLREIEATIDDTNKIKRSAPIVAKSRRTFFMSGAFKKD